MKTMLDCDATFELLTAAPVDAASTAAEHIDEHLAVCASCREFAEAMRPAWHLLHESLPAGQRDGLPMYLSTEDVKVQSIMQQIQASPSVSRRKIGWFRPIYAMAIAAACALLMACAWSMSDNGVSTAAIPSQSLMAMSLPTSCLQIASVQSAGHQVPHPIVSVSSECEHCHATITAATAHTDQLGFVCCTNCHTSSKEKVVDMSTLLVACSTCHAGT